VVSVVVVSDLFPNNPVKNPIRTPSNKSPKSVNNKHNHQGHPQILPLPLEVCLVSIGA
jgi:hypothetical protein